MTTEEPHTLEAVLESKEKAMFPSERDAKGRFMPGNKIGEQAARIGVSSLAIRRHRAFINDHAGELLEMLMKEALENKNIHVAMWLINKVIPETKKATFVNASLINNIGTLTELKDQSAQTIKEGSEGILSLEETSMLMNAYKDQRDLIEAADIEHLAQEVRKRMARRNI